MRIDAHAHLVPRRLIEDVALGRLSLPSLDVERDGESARIGFPGQPARRAVDGKLYDAETRAAWLEARGLDRQVVGPWIDLTGYTLPEDEAVAWSRAYNQAMLDLAAETPAFLPLATLPMAHGRAAELALEEAAAAGFRGCMIGTQPKGRGGLLDDPALEPFWQAASTHGMAVFIHAMADSGDPRLADYGLGNALGRITDVAIAVARLLYAGHPERYPGARIVLPIAGAALPFALGRLKRNHELAPDRTADPETGLHRVWFDTVVQDPAVLRFVGARLGFERMIMGSDQPFAMGDPAPERIVDALGLDPETSAGIKGGNAARLLGLAAA